MKKFLFTCIFSAAIFIANAQINKGSILLGGNISANTSSSKNGTSELRQTYWMINPSVGYAFKTNRLAGLTLGYGQNSNRSENGTTTLINRINNYRAGVYYRQYFPVGKNISLYGQGDLGFDYQRRNVTNIPNSYIEKQLAVGFSVSPGVSYAVSRKVMIELGFTNLFNIGYSTTKTGSTGTTPSTFTKSNAFTIGLTPVSTNSLNFGFRFLLGNK